MGSPRVSILIPTLEAEGDLARLLPALAQQEIPGGHELCCIDSDSRDLTRVLLRRAGARVEWIERSSFRHGPTRNRLAGMARGELLVFLSQDAVPDGADCLATLLEPFQDERVAGATARILPHEDDDALTARTVLGAAEASGEREVYEEGHAGLRFNNVTSAIRASVLAEHPFPDVPFGEDLAWARAALAAGHRVVHEPRSVVRHAHRYTPSQAFERYRVDAAFRRRELGERVRPDLFSVARGWAHELREDWRHVRIHGGWADLLQAPNLRLAQVLGQYFGSRGWNPGRRSGAATEQYG